MNRPRLAFESQIPPSKSLWIRAILLKTYLPELEILTASAPHTNPDLPAAHDVQCALHILKELQNPNRSLDLNCGHSAAVFRFFALRISRIAGSHRLHGSPRLFERPQENLISILGQLGVRAQIQNNGLNIEGNGWLAPKQALHVPTNISSQFASAILLNSWDLPFDLKLHCPSDMASRPYFDMSLELIRKLGLNYTVTSENIFNIPAGQSPKKTKLPPNRSLTIEPDMSCTFAIACFARIFGTSLQPQLAAFAEESLQPDAIYTQILEKMGDPLHSIEVDLHNAPDLFPMLAALASFAKGTSHFFGASQLAFKESNRIQKTSELLTLVGITHTTTNDGITITGEPTLGPNYWKDMPVTTFDPDHDHRMAMAAALFQMAGAPLQISTPEVVLKSFPGFWNILEKAKALPPKITLLAGHRGVGKSALLKRIQHYTRAVIFDLDTEIEKRTKKSIAAWFQESEERFREIEVQILNEIIGEHKNKQEQIYIALGAGFELKKIPNLAELCILWIRRESDHVSRVFLDRPRLNTAIDAKLEYQERFLQRQNTFKKLTHATLGIPEGWDFENSAEEMYFQNRFDPIPGGMSIRPSDLLRLNQLTERPISFFELRTDWLSDAQIAYALHRIEPKRVLISIRKTDFDPRLLTNHNSDWALELGPVPTHYQWYSLSVHDSVCVQDAIQKIEAAAQSYKNKTGHEVLLKLAPVVNTFEELQLGHQWAMQNPAQRSFLPRANESGIEHQGRWIWYRLWTRGLFPIQFFREGNTEQSDLPFLLDWIRPFQNLKDTPNAKFGAVLGTPVFQSRTPAFHYSAECPFFSIDLNSKEWHQALPVLKQLGLKKAAITSPLKQMAAELVGAPTPINTLLFLDKTAAPLATNTDPEGFRILAQNIDPNAPTVIWGGGGTLTSIRSILPNAIPYSIRTQQPREAYTPVANPTQLIWAAPANTSQLAPPKSWKPALIVDLSYVQSSDALVYAQKISAKYVSGISMFNAQAQAQSLFWEQNLRRK